MKMDMAAMQPKLSEAADLMNMLSQPVRLQILCTLYESEMSVLDLAETVGLSQPGISHHLKKLRDAELVKTRREAQTIFYALKGQAVEAVMKTLHGLYCE
ncbi:unnamed protein product [Cyprideis torosa]|uniref:Uncharacterized protein n=1 Tax=Cyprideis torosa TaxID=163714 RepID=A0A7R8ZYQ2_9CRUS|nr:unnamed protein product [Cyprideis torosa]CAG0911578.1 unnamed protein product [Cyprideis torosa]